MYTNINTELVNLIELFRIAQQLKNGNSPGYIVYDENDSRGTVERKISINLQVLNSEGTGSQCTSLQIEDDQEIIYETTHIEIIIPTKEYDKKLYIIDGTTIQIAGYRYPQNEPEENAHQDENIFKIRYSMRRGENIAPCEIVYKDGRREEAFPIQDAITIVDGVCKSVVDSLKTYLASNELHSEFQTGIKMF